MINQNVDETVFDNEKKKKKKIDENDTAVSTVLEPINVQDLKEEFKDKLNILQRITFSFSNPVKTHSLVRHGYISFSNKILRYSIQCLSI